MTVEQLMDKLIGIEDKTQTVEVSISQYNQLYPVEYLEIKENGYPNLQSDGHSHRIQVTLPYDDDNYYVVAKRKFRS